MESNIYRNTSVPLMQRSHVNDHNTNRSRNSLVSKVDIHVSCSDLCDKDLLSKSDPMVVMYIETIEREKKGWKEYDRTEIIKDDLNPKFLKSFSIEYYFEMQQKLKFEVYDIDSGSKNLEDHDYLGGIEVTLVNIIGFCGKTVTKNLFSDKKEKLKSTISFTAEELLDNKETITLKFKAKNLEHKDIFSTCNPYLMFSRCSIEESQYIPVYQTEKVKNNQNPEWVKFAIPLATLCNGDKYRTILIECYNGSAKNNLIGSCETTVNEILQSNQETSMVLIKNNKKNKASKKYGILTVSNVELLTRATFLDYVINGLQLCFHVAIDFTASNGNPALPSSLHYISDTGLNQYMQALQHVGQICEDYDTDKLISAYGFGAKINGSVSHDFLLNFSRSDDPQCQGINGVLQAYEEAAQKVQFFGPTNFSPVINIVRRIAEEQRSFNRYHILLILTDGIISDMGQTKKAIIEASKLPISLLIVGVGSADFSSMVELDSDNSLLSHHDETAERDIVQFVPYQKFSGVFSGADLAEEILYEVPNQIVSYMEKYEISPEEVDKIVIPDNVKNLLHFVKNMNKKDPANIIRRVGNFNDSSVSGKGFPPHTSQHTVEERQLSAKEYALQVMEKRNQ